MVTPVTRPDEEPMVATEALLLNHVPPPGLVSGIVAPAHNADAPLMAVGNGLTVIVVMAEQPVLMV